VYAAIAKKGRYIALTVLLPVVGASMVLDLRPNHIEESLEAIDIDFTISSAVGTMLAALWAQLYTSTATANPEEWHATWAPHLLPRLCGAEEHTRQRMCMHILPPLAAIDPQVIGVLLKEISNAPAEDAVRLISLCVFLSYLPTYLEGCLLVVIIFIETKKMIFSWLLRKM